MSFIYGWYDSLPINHFPINIASFYFLCQLVFHFNFIFNSNFSPTELVYLLHNVEHFINVHAIGFHDFKNVFLFSFSNQLPTVCLYDIFGFPSLKPFCFLKCGILFPGC